MKTNKIVLISALMVFSMSALNMTANSVIYTNSDESYINDIPFSTEAIAEEQAMIQLKLNFDHSDEYEIDDLPFEVNCQTPECRYETAMAVNFDMNEEECIDDIPFSTEVISENFTFNNNVQIDFSDEDYINDIPFNTFAVVEKKCCSLMCSK